MNLRSGSIGMNLPKVLDFNAARRFDLVKIINNKFTVEADICSPYVYCEPLNPKH